MHMDFSLEKSDEYEREGISDMGRQVKRARMDQKCKDDESMDTDQQSKDKKMKRDNLNRLRWWRYLEDITPKRTLSENNLPLAATVDRPFKKKPKNKPLSRRISI